MRSFNRDQDDGRVFTRRATVAAGASLALMGAVAVRLYHMQVLKRDYWTRLAEDNRINRKFLAPIRGRILDRDGLVLAGNSRNYRVVLIPEQISTDGKGRIQVKATLDRLANILPINERARERIFKEVKTSPRFRPITVAEGLSWEEFARLSVLLPDLPGVQPEVGQRRDYPFGPYFSHVLGYVGRVSDAEIEAMRKAAARDGGVLDPVLEETLHLPTFRIGKSGIEYSAEKDLRGEPGVEQVEVNAFGREIKLLSHDDGKPGADLHLTLDGTLQNYIMDRIGGESAAIVVMDVVNGDILALVSAPGFEPNPFAIGLTQEQWTLLRDDDHDPLINKPLAGQYPPGSTFKLATALAALESGKIRPEQTFFCSGSFPFGDHVFHCWKKEGHGWMNFHDGIKHSCDCYFYQVSLATGIDQIAKSARALGLGTNYDFPILGAKNGLIPDTQWKKRALGVKWFDGETLSAAIGQGYTLATPLQLAVMAARVAGGRAVVPRIIHAIGDRVLDPHPAPELAVNPAFLARVRSGMNGVSNEPGGTAFISRITEPGFELCGKTGTAQVRRITMEERYGKGVIKNEDLPWKLRDHALFVAYAPAHKPRFAISVLVEHGGGGGKTAAPIGRDVLLFTQQRPKNLKSAGLTLPASALRSAAQ